MTLCASGVRRPRNQRQIKDLRVQTLRRPPTSELPCEDSAELSALIEHPKTQAQRARRSEPQFSELKRK